MLPTNLFQELSLDVRQSGRSEARRLFCLQIMALLGLFFLYDRLGCLSPGFPFLD